MQPALLLRPVPKTAPGGCRRSDIQPPPGTAAGDPRAPLSLHGSVLTLHLLPGDTNTYVGNAAFLDNRKI